MNTQELRTIFAWDTRSVEAGAKKVEKAYDRIGNALKKLNNFGSTPKLPTGDGGGHGGGGGSMHTQGFKQNAIAGFRDLAEGRTKMAALRFASALKIGSAALGFFAVAGTVAVKTLAYIGKQMDETDQAASRLEASFLKVSKKATFANYGQGAGELGGTIDELREQHEGNREQTQKLTDLKGLQNSNIFTKAIFGGWDAFRSSTLGGAKMSTEQKLQVSDTQDKITGQQIATVEKARTDARYDDRDTAFERLRGTPGKAAQMEINRAETAEVAEARKNKEGENNIAAIKAKYDLQREAAARATADKHTELDLENELNTIRLRGGQIEIKTAEASLAAAKKAFEQAEAHGNAEDFSKANAGLTSAQEGVRQAKQNIGERDVRVRSGMANASLRGASDFNTNAEITQRIKAAKENLALAHGETQQKERQLELDNAIRAQQERIRDVVINRIGFEKENRIAGSRLQASGIALTGTGDRAAMAQANAGVADAVTGVNAAQKTYAANPSEDNKQAVVSSINALKQAEIERAAVVKQIALAKKDELTAIRAENSATQEQLDGHERLSQITRIRANTEKAVVEALRQGRTELAAQLRIKGQLEENAVIHDKYLQPDGRRRRAGDIHREERNERNTARRIGRFDKKLAGNGGLMNVHRDSNGHIISGYDPITKRQTTAHEMYARKTRAEAQVKKENEDASNGLPAIYKILNDRLPAASK